MNVRELIVVYKYKIDRIFVKISILHSDKIFGAKKISSYIIYSHFFYYGIDGDELPATWSKFRRRIHSNFLDDEGSLVSLREISKLSEPNFVSQI